MAILQSCCFCKSVHKGCYASAIYTLIYYSISFVIASVNVYNEQKYLMGETEKPEGESILEKESISSMTVIFIILLSFCSGFGCISSILLIIGLTYDQRYLLLPWILILISDITLQISHFIYLVIIQTVNFEPITATIFTIDFFILCLNIYCLLCVISQYQEYRNGHVYRKNTPQISYDKYSNSTSTDSRNSLQKNKNLTSPLVHTNCTTIPEEPSQSNDNLGNLFQANLNTFQFLSSR